MNIPTPIQGVRHLDDRGILRAFNMPENFTPVRSYVVSNWRQGFIRAWHGHLRESKLIYMSRGTGLIAAVELSDTRSPSQNEAPVRFVIDASTGTGVFIPKGFANGMMSLTQDAEFTILSDSTLEQSKSDDFRYPFDYWNAWEIEQR